ncbi:unnamed protein product [Closterium sp. Naga37s-1]|nr:unnamed protein product [Closterium sp. Naga37s-1]
MASRQLSEDASVSRQLSEDESVSREVWEQDLGPRGLKLEVVVARVVGSDGHNWLKYGQKQVQRSNATRCYYKCTRAKTTISHVLYYCLQCYYKCSRAKTSLRCPAKKTVDINCRNGSDPLSPDAIQVAYRCRLHNHPAPPISRPPNHPTVPIYGPTKRPNYRRTYRPLDRPMSHHSNLAVSHGGAGCTAASSAARLDHLAAALDSPDGGSHAALTYPDTHSHAALDSQAACSDAALNAPGADFGGPLNALGADFGGPHSPPGLAGLIPVSGCSTDLNYAVAVHTRRSTIYEELRLLDLRSQMLGEDGSRRFYDAEEDSTDEIFSSLGAISPTNQGLQDLQELQELSLPFSANHVGLLPNFSDAGLVEEEQIAGGVVVGNGESLKFDLHGDGEEGSLHGSPGTRLAAPMGHVSGAAVQGAAVPGAAVPGAAVQGAAVQGAAVQGAAALSGCGAVTDAHQFQTQKEPLTQNASLTDACAVSDAPGLQTQQDLRALQQQQQQEKQQQQQPQQQQQRPSKQTDQVTALLLSLIDSFLQSNNTAVQQPAPAVPGILIANCPAPLPATHHATLTATLPACASHPLTATTCGTLRNVRKRPASATDAPPPSLRVTDQAYHLAMFPTTSNRAMFGPLHQQQAMLKPWIPAAVVAFLGGDSTIRVSDFAAVGERKELQSWLEGAA